ncbi:MAG: DUF2336 domain-containing protein [Pseudomonadota bacterium]
MSELVDFERVENTHTQAERNRLMEHVVQLYALSSDRITPDLLAIYDDVLVRLADMVEEAALVFVAEKLAPLARAPRTMVRRLASEPIHVSRPVLEHSEVLTDEDLADIARSQTDDHRDAIAGRQSVAPLVSAAIVEHGGHPVKLKLARNSGASFHEESFASLVQDAHNDEELQSSLADREDLPADVVRALVDVATDSVRRKLLRHGRPEIAKRVTEAAGLAAERLSNEQWLMRYDFDAAARNVQMALKCEPVTEAMLVDMAKSGKFAESVVVFSMCAGVALEEAKHWCVRLDPKPFLIVCKALGFSRETVSHFLKLGPWLRRLDHGERDQSLLDYDTLDETMAMQVFQEWKKRQVTKAA